MALDRWYVEAFPGHPYGRSADGTPETIARITVGDLKAMHGNLLARDILQIVIVGDIDKRAAAEALDAVFGGLPEKAKSSRVEKIEPRAVAGARGYRERLPPRHGDVGLPR